MSSEYKLEQNVLSIDGKTVIQNKRHQNKLNYTKVKDKDSGKLDIIV